MAARESRARSPKPGAGAKARKGRYGLFRSDPDRSGYENLIGTCSECRAESIFNRATDLDGTYSSADMVVRCQSCRSSLRVGSDVANHPVDQLVYDAYEPMSQRRYMQVVILAAQSLELALAMCVQHAVLSGVPKPKRVRTTSPVALAARELDAALDRMTLATLRKLVIVLATLPTRPASASDARELISRLKRLSNATPDTAAVEQISNADLRAAVSHLSGIEAFVKFRNKVVHEARRPTQQQAARCLYFVPQLTRALLHGFGVMRGQLVMAPRAR